MNVLCIYLDEKGVHLCTFMYWNTLSAFTTEPLDGCLRNSVDMKYSWSRTCVQVFRPTPPKDVSRAGHKYVNEGAFSKQLFLQIRRLRHTNRIHGSDLKRMGRTVIIFCFILNELIWMTEGGFNCAMYMYGYTLPFLQNRSMDVTKLGRNELIMPCTCVYVFLARLIQVCIQGSAKIDQ